MCFEISLPILMKQENAPSVEKLLNHIMYYGLASLCKICALLSSHNYQGQVLLNVAIVHKKIKWLMIARSLKLSMYFIN